MQNDSGKRKSSAQGYEERAAESVDMQASTSSEARQRPQQQQQQQRQQQSLPVNESPAQASNAVVDRPSQLLRFILIGALVICGGLALFVRGYLKNMHRDVVAEISSLADGSDQVTTVAWSPDRSATLLIGTRLGQVYQIDDFGPPTLLPMPDTTEGPIVKIDPKLQESDTGGVVGADIEWLDPKAESGTPFRGRDAPPDVDTSAPPSAQVQADDAKRKSIKVFGKKVAMRPTVPLANAQAIESQPDVGDVTAVGSVGVLDPFPGGISSIYSDATAVGYRDGSLRLINNQDKTLIWARRGNSGPPADAGRTAASRSVIAITSRHDKSASPSSSVARRKAGNGALFATASADGEVRVIRPAPAGSSPRIQRVVMAEDGPVTGPNAASTSDIAVPIRPTKDGLLLSQYGTILMMYGPAGVAIANLAEGDGRGVARSFRRFMPDWLASRRTSRGQSDVVTLLQEFSSNGSDPRATDSRLPEQRDRILQLQEALSARGFEPGPIDGIPGAATKSAFAKYKEARLIAGDLEAYCSLRLPCPDLRISAATLSPRGDLFAVAGNDGIIHVVTLPSDLRELSRAKPLSMRGHSGGITQLAISTNGRYLASVGLDGRVLISDIEREKQTSSLPLRDLLSGPALPEMGPTSFAPNVDQPDQQDPIITLSTRNSLQAAQTTATKARTAGFTDVGIYRLRDSFITAARFPDQNAQQEALVQLRERPPWSREAYPGFLSELCPASISSLEFIRCDSRSAN